MISTAEDPIPKEVIEKKLTKMERATVQGCLNEMEILKQKMEHCYEKLDRMTALYQTNLNELQTLRVQYAKLANVRINHGPTQHDNGA